jgi:peptide/nickel transport system substrate-binding protein
VKLDPANVTDGESSNVIEQVFEGLVRFKPGTTEVEPCLAVSWTQHDEARRWTFKIRPDVRFHDGTPLTPAAVASAFERQRDEAHPHRVRGEYAYWKDLLASYVEKVEAGPGPDEVTFRCSRPAPAFFTATLAAFAFGVPSPDALAKHGDAFARNPVGTGPFRFVSWNLGAKEIALERFDGHWEGKPALARVVYQVSEDATARSQRLRAGGADVIDNLAPETIATLRAEKGVVVVERPGMNVAYLSMNNQRAPFDDPRVREAVALAIDKDRIVQAAYAGFATVAHTPVPPTAAGSGTAPAPRRRDVARARALLDEVRRSRPSP